LKTAIFGPDFDGTFLTENRFTMRVLSRLPLDAMRGSLFDLTTGRISRYIL